MNCIFNLLLTPHFNSTKESDHPDLFKLIISELDDSSFKQATSVCKKWKRITIESAKNEQLYLIQQLASALKLPVSNAFSDCDNLIQIREITDSYQDQFLEILKKLTRPELDSLEITSNSYKQPRFFKNLFVFAKMYQKKEQDYTYAPSKSKCHFLTIELLKNGYENQALKVASSNNPNYDFLTLANILARKGQIYKAIEMAKQIPDKKIQAYSIKQVVASCFHQDNLLNLEAWDTIRIYG